MLIASTSVFVRQKRSVYILTPGEENLNCCTFEKKTLTEPRRISSIPAINIKYRWLHIHICRMIEPYVEWRRPALDELDVTCYQQSSLRTILHWRTRFILCLPCGALHLCHFIRGHFATIYKIQMQNNTYCGFRLWCKTAMHISH